MQTNANQNRNARDVEWSGIDANHRVSFYSKENATAFFKHAVAEEETERIGIYDGDIGKGLNVIKRAGLQLPGKLNSDGLVHKIAEEESPVNKNNKKVKFVS